MQQPRQTAQQSKDLEGAPTQNLLRNTGQSGDAFMQAAPQQQQINASIGNAAQNQQQQPTQQQPQRGQPAVGQGAASQTQLLMQLLLQQQQQSQPNPQPQPDQQEILLRLAQQLTTEAAATPQPPTPQPAAQPPVQTSDQQYQNLLKQVLLQQLMQQDAGTGVTQAEPGAAKSELLNQNTAAAASLGQNAQGTATLQTRVLDLPATVQVLQEAAAVVGMTSVQAPQPGASMPAQEASKNMQSAQQEIIQTELGQSVGQPSVSGSFAAIKRTMMTEKTHQIQQKYLQPNQNSIQGGMSSGQNQSKTQPTDAYKQGMHLYESDKPLYAMGFKNTDEFDEITFAVGTYCLGGEGVTNKIEVVKLQAEHGLVKTHEIPHQYPPNKIQWAPASFPGSRDFLASASDVIRIWNINSSKCDLAAELTSTNRGEGSEQYSVAPPTSFDWNRSWIKTLASGSIDGTCSVWDLHKQKIIKQLVAHESSVNDLHFTNQESQFVTGGQDGQVRQFDLRNLENSFIIYNTGGIPILRVLFNMHNQHQIALLLADRNQVVLVDQRIPSVPLGFLPHTEQVNCAAWNPLSNLSLATASDDSKVFIWQMDKIESPQYFSQNNPNGQFPNAIFAGQGNPVKENKPSYEYKAGGPISQMCWSPLHCGVGVKDQSESSRGSNLRSTWMGIVYDQRVQILKW